MLLKTQLNSDRTPRQVRHNFAHSQWAVLYRCTIRYESPKEYSSPHCGRHVDLLRSLSVKINGMENWGGMPWVDIKPAQTRGSYGTKTRSAGPAGGTSSATSLKLAVFSQRTAKLHCRLKGPAAAGYLQGKLRTKASTLSGTDSDSHGASKHAGLVAVRRWHMKGARV